MIIKTVQVQVRVSADQGRNYNYEFRFTQISRSPPIITGVGGADAGKVYSCSNISVTHFDCSMDLEVDVDFVHIEYSNTTNVNKVFPVTGAMIFSARG